MEEPTLVNSSKTRSTDMVFTHGQTEECTREDGRTVSNTEKEPSSIQLERKDPVNGNKDPLSNGTIKHMNSLVSSLNKL